VVSGRTVVPDTGGTMLRFLADLKIGWKLALGFGTILAIFIAVVLMCFRGYQTVGESLRTVKQQGIDEAQLLDDFSRLQMEYRKEHYAAVVLKDPAAVQKSLDNMLRIRDEVTQRVTKYRDTVVAPEAKQNAEKLEEGWKAYVETDLPFNDSVKKGDYALSMALVDKLIAVNNEKVKPVLEKQIAWSQENAQKQYTMAGKTMASIESGLLVFTIAAIAVSLTIGMLLTTTIRSGLTMASRRMQGMAEVCIPQIEAALQGLADGDLTQKLESHYDPIELNTKDELGQLARDINKVMSMSCSMVQSFNKAQTQLRNTVSTVAERARFVAETSTSLSEASTSTAYAAQQIASTSEQVASAVHDTAQAAGQIAAGANRLASDATNAAGAMQKLESSIDGVNNATMTQVSSADAALSTSTDGVKTVNAMINAMDALQKQVRASTEAVLELGAKQEQIGAIVKAIDDISAQTNLLALNAAIEAARAGEHGRGFAVVADEVRKLAERAGTSTQEIAELIQSVRAGVDKATQEMERSADLAEAGNAHGGAASKVLDGLREAMMECRRLADVNKQLVVQMSSAALSVGEVITSVASVSQETAAGSEEMSAAAQQMSASFEEVTSSVEEQSASVEHVSETAHVLSDIARELDDLMSQFTIEERHDSSRVISRNPRKAA